MYQKINIYCLLIERLSQLIVMVWSSSLLLAGVTILRWIWTYFRSDIMALLFLLYWSCIVLSENFIWSCLNERDAIGLIYVFVWKFARLTLIIIFSLATRFTCFCMIYFALKINNLFLVFLLFWYIFKRAVFTLIFCF